MSSAQAVEPSFIGHPLLSPALRAATLGAKLLLTLVLARWLGAAEVGLYGILVGGAALAIQIAGLDFYTYANREVLGRDPKDRTPLIRDQIAFVGFAGLAGLPLGALAALLGPLPASWFLAFAALVFLEHLSQEAYRLLVALSRPGLAQGVLFLRGGAWALLWILWVLLGFAQASLEQVVLFWLVGDLLAIALATTGLRSLSWSELPKMDWSWIRRGLPIGLRLWCANVLWIALAYLDRFFLAHQHGEAVAGVYTLYWSLASVIPTLAGAAWTARAYPGIVAAGQAGDLDELRRRLRSLAGALVPACAVMGLLLLAGMHFFAVPLAGDAFAASPSLSLLLVLAAVTLCLAEVPFYGLYALGRDRALIGSGATAFALNLLALSAWVPEHGALGAAAAALLGRFALAAGRLWAWRRTRNHS